MDNSGNKYIVKKFKNRRKGQMTQRAMDTDEFYSALLESDKILKLVDVYEHPSRVHIYEDFSGDTLADLLKANIEQDKKLTLQEVNQIIYQLLDILEFLDTREVVYRNLKPENILLARKEDITILKIFSFESAF